MTIQQLKDKATASELCLINEVIKAHEEEGITRFIRILQQNILGMTDAWMDRRQAEGIKSAFNAAQEEFRKNS